MSEVSERFFSQSCIGNVQAWAATPTAVSVAVSFYARVSNADSRSAYVFNTLNLSAADARALAATLIAAADWAEAAALPKPDLPNVVWDQAIQP